VVVIDCYRLGVSAARQGQRICMYEAMLLIQEPR
jgi:hypothetical protein